MFSHPDPRRASKHPDILPTIINALRCPNCDAPLRQCAEQLLCDSGHSFDRAKQGHITLRTGARTSVNADSADMVAARAALLSSGIYAPIATAVMELVEAAVEPNQQHLVVDMAGGTGYYLARVLDNMPNSAGVSIDLSAAANKRAARAHPRIAAIGADLNRRFPLADRSVSIATSFFGPRNVQEIQRVLRDDGVLVVVTPTTRHLAGLRESMGTIAVDPHKDERLMASLRRFVLDSERLVEYRESASRETVRALVGMGPSAHHITASELEERVWCLSERTPVVVSVNVRVFQKSATG